MSSYHAVTTHLSGMLVAAVLTVGWSATAAAHPIPLAKATLTIPPSGEFQLELTCDLAAYAMQARPGHLDGQLAEEFLAMPPDDLEAAMADARRSFEQRLILRFDGQAATLRAIELPDGRSLQNDFRQNPMAPGVIRAAGTIPPDAKRFSVAFPVDVGTVSLSVLRGGAEPVRQLLSAGETSEAIWLRGRPDRDQAPSPLSTALRYLVLGFEHILPLGLDHILFVLGLFLLSPRLKPLLWQVTAFTVAHSITLALASYQVVSLPAAIVEPLIALSITLVAVENMLTTRLQPWRPAIVFAFGLLHGLGFAGVLKETGLPQNEFLTALLAFNVGVELGQLAVIALALVTIGWFRERSWYRSKLAVPLSCIIAAIGLFWTVQRIWQ